MTVGYFNAQPEPDKGNCEILFCVAYLDIRCEHHLYFKRSNGFEIPR